MTRITTTLLFSLALAAALAGGALAHSATVHLTIRHQLHHCHTWAVGSGPYKASQRIVVARGTEIEITNDDIMPHRLVQLSGPHASIEHALMNRMSASSEVVFTRPGTYSFGTKTGEDYMPGMTTIGADNVLRLTVVVR